jgi:hypothetical protein
MSKIQTDERRKHPGGRPSKYDPAHAVQIIRFFSVPKNQQIVKSVTTGKNEYEKTEYQMVANTFQPSLVSPERLE